MRKYIIHPGNIISKNDVDTHWISAFDLLRLYKVKTDESLICTFCERWKGKNLPKDPNYRCKRDLTGFTHLFPPVDGYAQVQVNLKREE